jgi:beta-lactamase regulating signal transducer with metallopeptidase domain
MITFFEELGSAVWRASWQAAVLALAIGLVLQLFGERVAPRWRHLIWSVALVRLLLIVIPASPWSAFNLTRWPASEQAEIALPQRDETVVTSMPDSAHAFVLEPPIEEDALSVESHAASPVAAVSPVTFKESPAKSVSTMQKLFSQISILRACVVVWLVGCLVMGLRIVATMLTLKRRLAACGIVSDPTVLAVLRSVCERTGWRTATLLVSPEPISPFVMGVWRRKIVVPESLVCEESTSRLRYVLAHELAHVVRGDLWANWLLLAARGVHWFNPAAWWIVREMRAERESACDELAIAALGESDRPAYASTIVDLAASLSLPKFAPVTVGLFSSTGRLQNRVERLVRFPSVKKVSVPLVAGLLLAIACVGLTDAMPPETESKGEAKKVEASATAEGVSIDALGDPIRMLVKSSQVFTSTSKIPKAQVDNPEVIRVEPIAATQLRVHAIKPGRTEVRLWDDKNNVRAVTIVVQADFQIRGRTVRRADKSVMPEVRLHLYKAEGRTGVPEKVAETVSDTEGRFEFTGLLPPRPDNRFDRLVYEMIAETERGPHMLSWDYDYEIRRHPTQMEVRMDPAEATLSGVVRNAKGEPVVGARVARNTIDMDRLSEFGSTVTDQDGRFTVKGASVYRRQEDPEPSATLKLFHPDYLKMSIRVKPDMETVFTLPRGCLVKGTVIDSVTGGRPARDAIVTVERLDASGETIAISDAAGRFQMIVAEGRYNILVEARDRVCVALTDREFQTGETTELPPLSLIHGGFMSGQIVNTATGASVALNEDKEPIALDLIGPSRPLGRAVSPIHLALADEQGRFTMRAAPGENFPYLVNTARGDRMAWDTKNQPPVIVKEGETTTYNMLITPKASSEEKLNAASAVIDSLSKEPANRTTEILLEFRKLNNTVGETELWCMLMRELVAIGKDAVPQICAELDGTTEDRMLRRLGFALRAIGDSRAVPALIRAIPRTLLPGSSDYVLVVADKDLATFMRLHDLDDGAGGTHFGFGRAIREIFGAIHKLSGHKFNDSDLFHIHLSEDPRRVVLQRRIYAKQAQQWEDWWRINWRERTDDVAYQKVDLKIDKEVIPSIDATPEGLASGFRLGDQSRGATLSPAAQKGKYATYFLDLDTGHALPWPSQISRDEARVDHKQLATWASANGIDLMCVTHRSSEGKENFVLKSFDMKLREISPRALRSIDKATTKRQLPLGREETGDLLMHFEDETKQYVPDANAIFVYQTREGNWGLIETTDRITRTANMTGMYGDGPSGVGFFKGVKFNSSSIIP